MRSRRSPSPNREDLSPFARHPHVEGGQQKDAEPRAATMRPPTMTMAKGRWNRADAARKSGGQQAERGDQHGHHDGAQAQDRAFDGGVFDGVPRARSWLMYSSMMTPVWTDSRTAPGSLRRRDAEVVPVISRASRPPMGAMARWRGSARPIYRTEHRVEDEKIRGS